MEKKSMRSTTYDIAPNGVAKAIILIRASLRTADKIQENAASAFGLTRNDFLWINAKRSWKYQVEGKSRSALVLDPFSLTFDADADGGFALMIKVSFDRIVNPSDCAERLTEWYRSRNPDAYLRMIAAGFGDQKMLPFEFEPGGHSDGACS
jgi:hypothetical protein